VALRAVVRGTIPAKILGVLLCASLITVAWATVDRLTLTLGVVVLGSLVLLASGQYDKTRRAPSVANAPGPPQSPPAFDHALRADERRTHSDRLGAYDRDFPRVDMRRRAADWRARRPPRRDGDRRTR
jgi:hypothetical protein